MAVGVSYGSLRDVSEYREISIGVLVEKMQMQPSSRWRTHFFNSIIMQ